MPATEADSYAFVSLGLWRLRCGPSQIRMPSSASGAMEKQIRPPSHRPCDGATESASGTFPLWEGWSTKGLRIPSWISTSHAPNGLPMHSPPVGQLTWPEEGIRICFMPASSASRKANSSPSHELRLLSNYRDGVLSTWYFRSSFDFRRNVACPVGWAEGRRPRAAAWLSGQARMARRAGVGANLHRPSSP